MEYYAKDILKETRITYDTLRHYLHLGLLQPRRHPKNGYRLYTEKDKETIRFIRDAQSIGFTLREIQFMLEQTSNAPCRHQALLPYLEEQTITINKKIRALLHIKKRLQRHIAEYQKRRCNQKES